MKLVHFRCKAFYLCGSLCRWQLHNVYAMLVFTAPIFRLKADLYGKPPRQIEVCLILICAFCSTLFFVVLRIRSAMHFSAFDFFCLAVPNKSYLAPFYYSSFLQVEKKRLRFVLIENKASNKTKTKLELGAWSKVANLFDKQNRKIISISRLLSSVWQSYFLQL